MELKRLFRSAVAVLLAASMLSSISAGAVATAVTTPETTIEGERLEGEYAPEGNAVYFGANTVTVAEENGLYHAKIYRAGDLSGTASVTIRSLDISARYGEDYELPGADTVTDTDTTLLERSVREQGEAEPVTGTGTLVTDDLDGIADGSAAVEITDFTLGTAAEEDAAPAGKSGLAAEKEAQTGTETREVSPTAVLNGGLSEALMEAITPQYLMALDYSAEQTVTFAPGEDEQEITFRILNDSRSEGTEGFSLMMVDAEGAEPYTNVAFSVTIRDDEPVVNSALSFSADSYKIEDGSVTVTVTRTGAAYSIASAVLTATDENGDVLQQGEVAFSPYTMEQEITLELSGAATLTLGDFTAAEAGDITEAKAAVSRSFFPVYAEEDEIVSLLADGNKNSFTVKLNGKSYKVEFTKGAATGKILDESYNPALEIGTYFFPYETGKGGMMNYGYSGDNPGWTGSWSHDLHEDGSNIWVQLEYYSGWTRDVGTSLAGMDLNASKVEALYYRKLIPDWSQYYWRYGGQRSEFNVYYNKSSTASADATISKTGSSRDFNRETDAGAGIEVKNRTGLITYRAAAIDNEKNMTPALRLCFYGVAALYKEYCVTTSNPLEKQYLAGSGTVSAVPVQFHVKSGAQVLGDSEARNLYVNPDENVSNIVFALQSNTINGVTDTFGTLAGYTITITPGSKDNQVPLSYPADFLNFISSSDRKTITGGADYSAGGIAAEKEKVTSHLDTIPMDKYFIDWIESVQKTTGSDSLGYTQSLLIRPEVDYCDVEVSFIAPEGDAETRGHFKNADYAAGRTTVFHAGDMLDLSGVSDDPSWHVVGYDVSTDGGVTYDTVRKTAGLVLLPNQKYLVRPAVAENANCIEVSFANADAAAHLSIANTLIPQSELPADLKGKNILNLNPDAATVYEKMRPQVGAAYSVDVIVTDSPAGSGTVYRPVIRDNMLRKNYNGQRYCFNARSATADNRLTVSLETVDASAVQTYSVSGNAMVSLPSVRNDGLGKHNTPAVGYTLFTPAGQGTMKITETDSSGNPVQKTVPCVLSGAASVSGTDGSFTISGIVGMAGDRIAVMLDNGYNDAQIAEITLAEDASFSAGMLEVSYPYTAPRVSSLTYSYDNPENTHKVDLRDNTVRAFDDTLSLTAVVDTKGRDVEKAVFVVTTTAGDSTPVDAAPVAEGGNIFTAQFPDMLNKLNNGDRISVYLVDKQTQSVTVGNSQETLPICYPTVETGLVIYVENEIIAPKNFEAGSSIPVNIPLMGDAANNVKTGQMTFSRVNWPDNMGYSLTIGLGLTSFGGQKSIDDKIKDKKAFVTAVREYNTLKNSLVEAENAMAAQNYTAEQINDSLAPAREAAEEMNPQGKFTKDAKVIVSGTLALAMDYIYNPVDKEYQLARFAITIGAGVNVNKTWYYMLGSFPCFLNFTGGAQFSIVFGAVCESGAKAVSQDAFNKYSGNLNTMLSQAGGMYQLDLAAIGKIQVGTGLCGILSARGYVSIGLNFQSLCGNQEKISGDDKGFAVSFAGGFGVDLVLFSIDFDIATMKHGEGTLKKMSNVSFFGGFKQPDKTPAGTASLASTDDTAYGETVTVSPYGSGTADMSSFGQAACLASQPQEVSRTVLLDNAADRTRPQLLKLPDGSDFLLFLGSAGRDKADDSCLYYTVRSGGAWSTPQPVEDDGTYDTMPDAILYDGKVVLAWMDASQSFSGVSDFREKYNSFDVSTAVYDPAAGTMGAAGTLVHNEYFAGYPSLCAANGYVDCVYMNRDISGVKTAEELLDYAGTYSTMARVSFCPDTPQNSDLSEQYIVIRNEELIDPLVTDYSRVSLQVDSTKGAEEASRNLFVSVYTVDTDADLTACGDREVYLSFYDADNRKDYYPIRISDNEIGEINPQVTNLGKAGTYVTWMNENGEFFLLNVDELARALFVSGAELGDPDSPDWYHVTALPDSVDDDDDFEGSIYAELNRDEFRIEQVALAEDGAVTVDEYQLATDGSDAYIFFVAPNPDYDSTGTDLYGMRYRCTGGSADAESGFTAPVAITHDDNVIDEFSLYVTGDRKVELVSNFFTQSINAEGKMEYSPNKLVNISFVPSRSVNIVPGSLKAEERLVPGTRSQVSFTVRNDGLFPADSWVYSLFHVCGGSSTPVGSGICTVPLEPGQEYTVYTSWAVPENIDGDTLAVTVAERGVEIPSEDCEEISLDGSAVLQADIRSLSLDENGMLKIITDVRNTGNANSAAYDEVLYDIQDPGNPVELYREPAPAIAPGGVHAASRNLSVSAENFDSFGSLNLRFVLEDKDGEVLASCSDILACQMPLIAGFNTESLALETGGTAVVAAAAAPWSQLAGDPVFASEDTAIAVVDDETGEVTAVSAGETTIYAWFPDAGIIAELPVTVTGETPAPASSGGGSHGNGSVKEDPTAGSNAYKDPTAVTTPTAPETPVTPANPETGDGTFTDVPASAYYAEPVDRAVEKGITNGTSATTFSPDMTCTRAQTVTFLWRAAGCPVVDDAENPFTDVSEDAYYYNAVLWAVANGITNGTSETTFSPNDTVTRGQTVTFLWRAAEEPVLNVINPFEDVTGDDYFYNAVLWAVDGGITNGTSETTFSPADGCTRGQIVTFLYRAQ